MNTTPKTEPNGKTAFADALVDKTLEAEIEEQRAHLRSSCRRKVEARRATSISAEMQALRLSEAPPAKSAEVVDIKAKAS